MHNSPKRSEMQILLAIVICCAALPVQAASFDCAKASIEVEHIICSNPAISWLDVMLDRVYKAAVQDGKRSGGIKRKQKQWLLGRNRCQDEECVILAYRNQIRVLKDGDIQEIQQHGESLKSFVPKGYAVGIERRGDLNGDGREDIAALLWISPNSTKGRPLIVLVGEQDGTYQLSSRTDYFSNPTEEMCGAGNFNCIPEIQIKNGTLIISLASGSAAGYYGIAHEFKLIGTSWYRVKSDSYVSGVDNSCTIPNDANDGERCVLQGISKNFVSGVAEEYCRFVDQDGNETRVERIEGAFEKASLKLLTETAWILDE